MPSSGWNIDLPAAEYYGPVPHAWAGRVSSGNLTQLIQEVEQQSWVAIDTETTGLVNWKDWPLYFSLAWGNRRATLHSSLLPYFSNAFKSPSTHWVLANAKYDMHMLANVGVYLQGPIVCTQVEHSLLYEEQSHRLKDMAKQLLGWRWSDFQDTFGRITKNFSAADLIKKAEEENFPLLIEYAANDAWGTLHVHHRLRRELESASTFSLFNDKPPYIHNLWDLFYKVESPYTRVLWKNERNGALIDMEYLARIRPIAEAELKQQEQDLVRIAGRKINPKSTPQLQEFFFSTCGVTPLKMTKGKQPSVDKSFLEHVSESTPQTNGEARAREFAVKLLEFRNVQKLHGTYIVGMGELADPNGRIHTKFNQDVARTGRLSSSEPNLQNIPNVEKDKWNLRRAFIAPRGYKLSVVDYSQLEMRLLAAASGERDMIQIFLDGKDIHTGNAEMVFGVSYADLEAAKKIDKKVKAGELGHEHMTDFVHKCLYYRRAIKSIGFGLNYGIGDAKLAAQIGIAEQAAANLREQYMNRYQAVGKFYADAIEETEATGYAFTILGRRRSVPEIHSRRRNERSRAERVAVNTQIQGSAADVVKCAQILLDKCGLDHRFDCHSQLQVHDELMHQLPAEAAHICEPLICEIMEHPFFVDLAVPLTVDGGLADNWQDAK